MRQWEQHILIRSLCRKKQKSINEKILPDISSKVFVSSPYKKAFQRLYSFYIKKGEFLTWRELVFDKSLPIIVRRKLKAREIRRKQLKHSDSSLVLPQTFEEYRNLLNGLYYDAKHTQLITLQNDLTSDLGKEDFIGSEIEAMIQKYALKIEEVRKLGIQEGSLFKTSTKKVGDRLKKFYVQLKKGFFIPTGFKNFDNQNLGIPLDSYVLISAKTGAGKTGLALQMAINMKLSGARVCFLPLEMSIEQMLLRMASNFLSVSVTDIVKNFKHYYKPVMKVLNKFIGDDPYSCLNFYEPELSETLDQVLVKLKPMQYDVIIIDYISLLAPMEGKPGWDGLNLASRYAKRYASQNKTIVCFLAQFDEELNRVRYSRAMVEDASNCFIFNESKETIQETGYVTIKQLKARNQDPFNFRLSANLVCSKFNDYQGYYEEETKPKKGRRMSKEFDDVPMVDDF